MKRKKKNSGKFGMHLYLAPFNFDKPKTGVCNLYHPKSRKCYRIFRKTYKSFYHNLKM